MFGFSKSKQSSQSQSTEQSQSFSLSGSDSLGYSQSTSGGKSTQGIAFADLFARLYGGATGAAATAAESVPLFQGEAAQLFSGGLDFLGQLQGAGAAEEYMTSRLTGPDAAAEAQLGALGTSLGDFFTEKLMTGITGGGVATGTLGGSRQGVQIAQAAKGVAGQYAQGAAAILGQSQQQRDALASTVGAQRIQAAGAGINALPSLLGLAQAGSNAALSPYLALAQILGGPTVLTESSQFGQSTAADVASSFGTSAASSYGQSTSSSKGKSIGVSFGPFGGGGEG